MFRAVRKARFCCRSPKKEELCKAGTMLGKPKHVENISNDLEVEELANFAVTEHNNQTVSLFVLGRIDFE